MEPEERAWLRAAAADAVERFGVWSTQIVNIGVALGASVHCLRAGAPAARLVAVDLDNSQMVGEVMDRPAEMVTADSAEFGRRWSGPVHLLFVDGDHSRAGVEADLAAWLGHVAPGGVVAFHDYNSDLEHVAGVHEAVDAHVWGPGWEEIPAEGSLKAFRRRSLRAGDPFGKLAVSVPYWKASWLFFQWWSWLLIGGLEDGDEVLLDVPGEVPMPMAHNAIVREFLRGSADTLLLIEDDHCGDQDVVRRMRTKEANLPFDVVCASYVNRRSRPVPMGWMLREQNARGYGCHFDLDAVQIEGTQEYDGAALGLVLIRRWVLEAMQGGRDPEDSFWFECRGANSLDIPFYAQARALGARVAVDRDAQIGHVGQYVWTMGDFVRWRDERQADEPANG